MTAHILKELWGIRDEIAKECGHDLRRLFEKLKAAQKSSRGKVVNRTKLQPSATAHR